MSKTIASVSLRPRTPNENTKYVEKENLINRKQQEDDVKPDKKSRSPILHYILTLTTLIYPFILYILGQEQLFSQYTPTIDQWLIMLCIGFVLSILSVLSNINQWNELERSKEDNQDQLKLKSFCLSVQLGTLLLFVFNYAIIVAATWNIRRYADQTYTHTGQEYNYLNELNGSPLRTNGVVSYVENHVIRQLGNLQSLIYFSVAYFAEILSYYKYRQLLSTKS
jgi:magnesium-transporting ATPase (P-type)